MGRFGEYRVAEGEDPQARARVKEGLYPQTDRDGVREDLQTGWNPGESTTRAVNLRLREVYLRANDGMEPAFQAHPGGDVRAEPIRIIICMSSLCRDAVF